MAVELVVAFDSNTVVAVLIHRTETAVALVAALDHNTEFVVSLQLQAVYDRIG